MIVDVVVFVLDVAMRAIIIATMHVSRRIEVIRESSKHMIIEGESVEAGGFVV